MLDNFRLIVYMSCSSFVLTCGVMALYLGVVPWL